MQIDFFWIDNFDVLQEQGFNCNPNVRYHFDPQSYTLHRKADPKVPVDFFATRTDNIVVTNVTALVGANGTGKSTFLRALSSFIANTTPRSGVD